MLNEHPPQPPGSIKGNAQEERAYFRACLARGGDMENSAGPTEGRGK